MLSIGTLHSQVGRCAVELSASVVNDGTAGACDPQNGAIVCEDWTVVRIMDSCQTVGSMRLLMEHDDHRNDHKGCGGSGSGRFEGGQDAGVWGFLKMQQGEND